MDAAATGAANDVDRGGETASATATTQVPQRAGEGPVVGLAVAAPEAQVGDVEPERVDDRRGTPTHA